MLGINSRKQTRSLNKVGNYYNHIPIKTYIQHKQNRELKCMVIQSKLNT